VATTRVTPRGMLPLVLLRVFASVPMSSGNCPTCPQQQHEHDAHHHFPVPDADTHQLLLGGPPAPVQQLGAVPQRQSVRLANASLLDTFMEQNLDYLLNSFTVDHILYNFRLRAGVKAPPRGGRKQGWDANLKGSNAGRFLMGAGNTLRWREHAGLRAMMDAVVEGIYACRNKTTGYIMAYHEPGFMHSEQGDYGRSWVTQGLIEAGKAGNARAFPMLRTFYDWFNDPQQNPYLPYLYDGIGNAEQGQIASTRMYLETPHSKYADSQTAQDTYRDDYWLRQLIAKDPRSMSNYHMPEPNHPHCYEITAVSCRPFTAATCLRSWPSCGLPRFDLGCAKAPWQPLAPAPELSSSLPSVPLDARQLARHAQRHLACRRPGRVRHLSRELLERRWDGGAEGGKAGRGHRLAPEILPAALGCPDGGDLLQHLLGQVLPALPAHVAVGGRAQRRD
jgi:hypothetical protein